MDSASLMEQLHLEDQDGSFPADATSSSEHESFVTSQSSPDTAEQSGPMVEVRKTDTMGYGLFATQKIPRGTRVVSEKPILQMHDPEYRAQLIERFCTMLSQLSSEEIETLSQLYCNPKVFKEEDRDAILKWYNANSVTDANGQELKGKKRQESRKKTLRRLGCFLTNCSGIVSDGKTGRGVFALFSRINHSCVPNARYGWNETIQRFTVHVSRDLAPDEQVFISYLPLTYDSRATRAEQLEESWGFECACVACSDPASEMARVKMSVLQLLLTSYEQGNKEVPEIMQLEPLKNRGEALLIADQLAKLLISEGLVSMELVKIYRTCSQLSLWLDDLDEATEYAEKALDIEHCLIGPETEHLREGLVGCQYWLEKMQGPEGKPRGLKRRKRDMRRRLNSV
ncbi:hypothetical protein PG993_005883 [Apiospora rasikravindrae]|uniref:SET domain-containing protein n=1 Tax=Apiospora rasikravindrae TaxID=990691 RepID=A0ABR1TA19_9PEZI